MRQLSKAAGTLGIGLLLSGFAVGALADQALVIGVNQYPGLPGCSLHGCVNDAAWMQAALDHLGFKTTLLTDSKASKAGILNALKSMQSSSKPGERFVLYFAGHGNRQGFLLPSSVNVVNGGLNKDEVLDANTLVGAVKAVPARSRTILLDACFSGCVIRGGEIGHSEMFMSRCARGAPDVAGIPVIRDISVTSKARSTLATVAAQSGVCYFTASRETEFANEDEVGKLKELAHTRAVSDVNLSPPESDKQVHGVFTYFLVQKLLSDPKNWNDVADEVSKHISDATGNMQEPTITTSFLDKPLFESKSATSVTNQPTRTVWDDFTEDHADPNVLDMRISPAQDSFQPGEQFKVTATVGADGWLVILNRDSRGHFILAYPRDANVDKCHYTAGRTVTFLSKSDGVGTERARCILFSSRDRAKALIDKAPHATDDPVNVKDVQTRELRMEVLNDEFTTADLLIQITNAPIK